MTPTVHMVVHELKCWPPYFEALIDGSKTFELRKDDRSFAVGDLLRLREFEPGPETYTGRETTRRVTYVLRGVFGVQAGFAVLGLSPALQPSPAARVDEGANARRLAWFTDDELANELNRRLAARVDDPAAAVRQALVDLTEAVSRGDEHGLPEAYRAARTVLGSSR